MLAMSRASWSAIVLNSADDLGLGDPAPIEVVEVLLQVRGGGLESPVDQLELELAHQTEDVGVVGVDEIPSELGVDIHLQGVVVVREDPAADASASLVEGDMDAGLLQLVRSVQPRDAGADDGYRLVRGGRAMRLRRVG